MAPAPAQIPSTALITGCRVTAASHSSYPAVYRTELTKRAIAIKNGIDKADVDTVAKLIKDAELLADPLEEHEHEGASSSGLECLGDFVRHFQEQQVSLGPLEPPPPLDFCHGAFALDQREVSSAISA